MAEVAGKLAVVAGPVCDLVRERGVVALGGTGRLELWRMGGVT